ncbi:aminotransferase class III-fold pyridoxal phosphate-dependent enzyme [Candidatus Roizmanbacteria bacterium]|nr:aminotransferase class III-fold pyridoxal phosphate-dependent enzyme [Candidatus Roizmanbacteria bacterium]
MKRSYLARGDFVYRHNPVPVFVKANGSIMEDKNGYKYFCAEAANGTTSLGFDSTIISTAIKKIKKIPSIPSFCETALRLQVSTKLGKKIESITGKKGKIAFELGGAQGVELALRIAKANNKKSQFVVFEGGYHGRSIYTAQLSASHRYRATMGDWRIPVVRLPYPDYEQSGSSLDRKTWKKQYMTYIKMLLTRETGGMIRKGTEQDICALILEPLLNAGGIVKPDLDLINFLILEFRKAGALIIVDEVFTGFYRTGKMFGFQHYDFIPDIFIMSKAISNGITPLSCVWAQDPLLFPTHFVPGSHSATFINQPLGLSIADTVFDRYEAWKTIGPDLVKLEKFLKSTIQEIVKSSPLVISGFALGGVGRLLLKEDVAGKILNIASTIAMKNPIDGIHGLILASTGMASNVIAFNPPLKMSKKDMKIMRILLLKTFKKVNSQLSHS